MSCKRLIILTLAATALAACSHVDERTGSVDRHFGEAAAWNKEAQVIDPDPVYDDAGAKPGDSGAVAAAASKRYRTDAVKQPQREQTTSGSTGSSGGGGSGPQ